MPNARNYVGEVHNRLLSLAQGRAELAALLKAGNVYSYVAPNASIRKPTALKAGGDYPGMWIRPQAGSDDQHSAPSFAEEADGFDPAVTDSVEVLNQNFRVLIVAPDDTFDLISRIQSEFLHVLRLAGWRLGLGYAKAGKHTWRFDLSDRLPECAGQLRAYVDGTIPVEITCNGARDMLAS